jgi:hypothetical protein
MQFEPKTAIAFRSVEERIVLHKVLEKQNIGNVGVLGSMRKGRAYICPENYRGNGEGVRIEQTNDPEDFAADASDPFKWTYVEAADVLRNLIIAERRKHAT